MFFIRSGVRIPVKLPVHVEWKAARGKFQQAVGETSGVSGNGMFMTLPARLRPETPITVTVHLPVEFTRTPLDLFFQGRVVGQTQVRALRGIGVIIDDYQFKPSRLPD